MVSVGPFEIDLVPASSWGKSLYQLSRTNGAGFWGIWKRIRDREIARVGERCEICLVSGKILTCHESWEYDESQYVQKLVGYRVTCRDCSNILHLGRASTDDNLWKLAESHFNRVTGLDPQALHLAWEQAMKTWEERSVHQWTFDISSEPLAQGFEDRLGILRWHGSSKHPRTVGPRRKK